MLYLSRVVNLRDEMLVQIAIALRSGRQSPPDVGQPDWLASLDPAFAGVIGLDLRAGANVTPV